MREIKFRAWDKDGKLYGIVDLSKEEDWYNYDPYFYNKFDMYTGIKDKNGVEIYEGDIVKPDNRNVPLIQVIWDDYIGGFNGTRDSYKNSEVVGNIYENPGLIGE